MACWLVPWFRSLSLPYSHFPPPNPISQNITSLPCHISWNGPNIPDRLGVTNWSSVPHAPYLKSVNLPLLPNKSLLCFLFFLRSNDVWIKFKFHQKVFCRQAYSVPHASPQSGIASAGHNISLSAGTHLICDCCMSSLSSPLVKVHSKARSVSGLASSKHSTATSSPRAAPNTSFCWLEHTGASAEGRLSGEILNVCLNSLPKGQTDNCRFRSYILKHAAPLSSPPALHWSNINVMIMYWN